MARYAVLIGINDYANESVTSLRFAENDAQTLETLLIERGGFKTCLLRGAQATREAIFDALEGSHASLGWPALGPADQFLFYFAGHGQLVDGHYVLHAYRAEAGRSRHSVSLHDLRQLLVERIPCQECVCIMDACRNLGNSGQRGAGELDLQSVRDIKALGAVLSESKIVQVLYGCDEGQASLEDPGLEHGVLTYHLAETLREGQVRTIEEACDDAADRMGAWLNKNRPGLVQRPQVYRPPTRRHIVLFDHLPENIPPLLPEIARAVQRIRQQIDAEEFDIAQDSLNRLLAESPLLYQLKEAQRDLTSARKKSEQRVLRENRRRIDEGVAQFLEDAKRFEEQGDLQSAKNCLEEAVKLQPTGQARAKLERVDQILQTGAADHVSQLARLFEQARQLEPNDPGTALEMYRQALEVYPGNPIATKGCERCQLKIMGKRATSVASERLENAKGPLPALKTDVQRYESVAMTAEAKVTRSEIERCERYILEASARYRFTEQLTNVIGQDNDWAAFSAAATSSTEIQKTGWLVRSLELEESVLNDLMNAGGGSVPGLESLVSALFSHTSLDPSLRADPEAVKWHAAAMQRVDRLLEKALAPLEARFQVELEKQDYAAAQQTVSDMLRVKPNDPSVQSKQKLVADRLEALAEQRRKQEELSMQVEALQEAEAKKQMKRVAHCALCTTGGAFVLAVAFAIIGALDFAWLIKIPVILVGLVLGGLIIYSLFKLLTGEFGDGVSGLVVWGAIGLCIMKLAEALGVWAWHWSLDLDPAACAGWGGLLGASAGLVVGFSTPVFFGNK